MKNYREELIKVIDRWLEGSITSMECINLISHLMIECHTEMNIGERQI